MLNIRFILDHFGLWTLSAHCAVAIQFARSINLRNRFGRSIPQSLLDNFSAKHSAACEKCLA